MLLSDYHSARARSSISPSGQLKIKAVHAVDDGRSCFREVDLQIPSLEANSILRLLHKLLRVRRGSLGRSDIRSHSPQTECLL